MRDVTVLILHRPAGRDAGPLERLLADARVGLAERHAAGFAAAGAAAVRIVAEDVAEPFGARLRRLAASLPDAAGLVVLGSGSLALAGAADRRTFVAAAAATRPGALANNRYSADAVALAGAGVLRSLPDLPGDNALPRWLDEVARIPVADLRPRWRLGVDIDAPADLLLPGVARATGMGRLPRVLDAATMRVAAVCSRLTDRRAEVFVAGRTSAATIAALERRAAARLRVLVEERGLRSASRLAQRDGPAVRPPRSVLGLLLDERGPGALGAIAAELGDAAIIDTRVLLAHRLGPDEGAWPAAEDRFASDLLAPGEISDPWLRTLTAAAAGASIPIALGGHTLVGPGLRLLAAGLGGAAGRGAASAGAAPERIRG
jgi:hypothetical protein